jgi:hypothetical protein
MTHLIGRSTLAGPRTTPPLRQNPKCPKCEGVGYWHQHVADEAGLVVGVQSMRCGCWGRRTL